MPSYILNDVPAETLEHFRERSKAEGWPMRALLLQLMEDYGAYRIDPAALPPPSLPLDSKRNPGPTPTRPGDVIVQPLPVGFQVWVVTEHGQQQNGQHHMRAESWDDGLQIAADLIAIAGSGRIFSINDERLWREEPNPYD